MDLGMRPSIKIIQDFTSSPGLSGSLRFYCHKHPNINLNLEYPVRFDSFFDGPRDKLRIFLDQR
jgi:hypothetical protein